MAAQKQHYVPQFILRQFLSDQQNERVSVYDKHDDKLFVTSIKNVMAERRFHEFSFDEEWMVSFEPIACAAEEAVLPAYRKVLDERRLSDNLEQKAALALLLAFQFLRTRAHREMDASLEQVIVEKVEAAGGRMQDIKGWEDWKPSSDDDRKRSHIQYIRRNLQEYAQIMAAKDFILAEAAPGRSFYLGDNPVVLTNRQDHGSYGNLGLLCTGLEIYLPLSSNLLLCALCPTILEDQRATLKEHKRRQSEALAMVMQGHLTAQQMKKYMDLARPEAENLQEILDAAAAGTPLSQVDGNMDYYNSLQTKWAYRHVVAREGDLELARRYNREVSEFRKGVRLRSA